MTLFYKADLNKHNSELYKLVLARHKIKELKIKPIGTKNPD